MSGPTIGKAIAWWDVPYGTVLRRPDDGETVMVIGKSDITGYLLSASLRVPEGMEVTTIKPGDRLGPFLFLTKVWEIVR